MEQITLHVYQSIDGCPVIADKCFNAVVDYGGETGVLLLDNGLADEIVMTTVPVLVGNSEKGLECGPNDGRIWAVRSSEVLEDGKIRTVYGRM